MRYTVFQFHMSREIADKVNELGWGEAYKQYPEVRIQRDCKFQGSEGFNAWMSEYFNPVCNIDADSLEGVFHIGNVGPEESIERLDRMHSVSVGDVVRDNETGTYHMVDGMGFTQLLSFQDQTVVA